MLEKIGKEEKKTKISELEAKIAELQARLATNEEADKNCSLCLGPLTYPLVHAKCGQFLACTICVVQLTAHHFRCPNCGVEELFDRCKWLSEKYVQTKFNSLNKVPDDPDSLAWINCLYGLINLRCSHYINLAITFSIPRYPCCGDGIDRSLICIRDAVSKFLFAVKEPLADKRAGDSVEISRKLRSDRTIASNLILYVNEGRSIKEGDFLSETNDCFIRIRAIHRAEFEFEETRAQMEHNVANHYFYQLNIGIPSFIEK